MSTKKVSNVKVSTKKPPSKGMAPTPASGMMNSAKGRHGNAKVKVC